MFKAQPSPRSVCFSSKDSCKGIVDSYFSRLLEVDNARLCALGKLSYSECQRSTIYTNDVNHFLSEDSRYENYPTLNETLTEYPITFHYSREENPPTWQVAVGLLNGIACIYLSYRILEIFCPRFLREYTPCTVVAEHELEKVVTD